MNRIVEKVKDIVDVRSHVGLTNFADDPLRTLNGYHFTVITADLMSKWLTRATRVGAGNGAALALAGFRGVGKSHFLAAFGAILAHSEYRSGIADPLVASTAQTIARRSLPVAFVRRGSHTTLLAELKDAIARIVGCEPAMFSDSLTEILMGAAESVGDAPLILVIDTALERASRVSRDDGAMLSEIAETAKKLGMFVGIALDDDISGADGANSSISAAYSIDYLDQEHLYKIVDTHIFPTQSRMQPVLHDIYEYYRRVVPSFRWSEERFSTLYPLHPSIMEIAPFVRLYMHDFALLSFASEAGARILGRPANSLIAPDEVFDKVEKGLRKIDALKEAFSAFDQINAEIIAKAEVGTRLQARLILKGLFLFSLNDEGSTAAEIGASMLIFDESQPDAAVRYVEEVLSSFAKAMPDRIRAQRETGGMSRYSFKLDGKEDLKKALAAAAGSVPTSVINEILKRVIDERYSDSAFTEAAPGSESVSTECFISWRGGLRKGQISWLDGDSVFGADEVGQLDWRAVINMPDSGVGEIPNASGVPLVNWNPAKLTGGEIDTIRRLYVLQSDAAFRNEFQDHIAAVVRAHAIAVDRIFYRSFLEDGVLSVEGFEYNFTDEARSAQSLSEILTIMLEPMFEGRFPMHPYFPQTIRNRDVAALVADLFGGARPKMDEVQRMAEVYGQPMGIVAKLDEAFVPADANTLRGLPLADSVLKAVAQSEDEVTSLASIFNTLGNPPYGLVREAGQLLLSALVSARLLEFVTSNGDRITHRSLDLRLIWEDIVGVTAPAESHYSKARLLMWASLLTGRNSFTSLVRTEDRLDILDGLQEWLTNWNSKQLTSKFDLIRDDVLNTRIWRLATLSNKAFRNVAESITELLADSLPLDGCLHRIADAFSDSEVEFARLNGDLETVESFVAGHVLRDEISGWLALSEITGVPSIDGMRSELYGMLAKNYKLPQLSANVDLGNLWDKFRRAYSGYFIERHDSIVRSTYLRGKRSDIMKTDIWWEFENLADIKGFDPGFWAESKRLVQRMSNLECDHDTSRMLEYVPACGCSFTLAGESSIESLPDELWRTVNQGLFSYREILRTRAPELSDAISQILKANKNDGLSRACVDLTAYLTNEDDFHRLTDAEIQLIRMAFQVMGPVPKEVPAESYFQDYDPSFEAPGIPDFTDAVDEFNALLEAMPQ